MYSKRLKRDLTPEEERSVNALVTDWIETFVEFKETEDGTPIFRLRENHQQESDDVDKPQSA